MSQIKIIKQDVMNSMKYNLNENNIDDLIQELKVKSALEIQVEVLKKSYMCFVANISLRNLSFKNSGFGRNQYEALKTALLNLIEDLLQDEKFVEPIKESLKIFLKNMKEPGNRLNNKENNVALTYGLESNNNIKKDNDDMDNREVKKNLTEIFNKNKNESKTEDLNGLSIVNESSFNIVSCKVNLSNLPSSINLDKIKEAVREKDLIILELEKLILDIMSYNKKIVEMFESESNVESVPNYYKCPISWERMENPVVTMEGHSYERWAIEKWLYNQQTSPITGLVLNDYTLINNYTLKSALDDFQKRQIKLKKTKVDLQKFLTKCEYDLNDLKKYFNQDNGILFL